MTFDWPSSFLPPTIGKNYGGSGLSSYVIALESWRRGLKVEFFSADLQYFEVSDANRTVRFNFSRPESLFKPDLHTILNRKWETCEHLRQHNVPTTDSRIVDPNVVSETELKDLGSKMGYPLVLKPNIGSMGKGVLTGLRDWEELREAFFYLKGFVDGKKIALERHCEGEDYRILVIGGQVAGAVKRVAAHVIGDGKSSIVELIRNKNNLRSKNPFLAAGLIKNDFEVEKCLESQGMSYESVPGMDTVVQLRRIANASAGGDVVDVTDNIPEKVKCAAIRATEAFSGLVVAGVDILYKSGDSTGEDSHAVIEINSRPHIGVNMYPTQGSGRNVPAMIVDYLFPQTPAVDSDRIKYLRFNHKTISTAILSGTCSSFTLSPLPEHLFPSKYRFSLKNTSNELTYPQGKLQKMALKIGISGSVVRVSDSELILVAGASSAFRVEQFASDVELITNTKISKKVIWDGSLSVGFSVK